MTIEATTVKAPDGAAPVAEAAAVTSTPTTALSAVESAFKEPAAASSAATGEVQPGAAGSTPPPVPGVQPPTPPPSGDPGLAQLRGAYDALKAKYSRYESYDPDVVARRMAEFDRFEADPVGWYRKLGTELGSHPELGPKLQPPKEDPEPQADLYQIINGEKVFVYSAGQQKKWQDWNDKRVDARIETRLNPLQSHIQQAQETTERNNIIDGARKTVTSVMTQMRTFPHFKEGEAKIAGYLAKIDPALRKEIGTIAALNLAYNQYLAAEIFPTISTAAEKKVRDEYAKKANAADGSVKPGTGAPAASGERPRNTSELADKLRSGAYANAGQ